MVSFALVSDSQSFPLNEDLSALTGSDDGHYSDVSLSHTLASWDRLWASNFSENCCHQQLQLHLISYQIEICLKGQTSGDHSILFKPLPASTGRGIQGLSGCMDERNYSCALSVPIPFRAHPSHQHKRQRMFWITQNKGSMGKELMPANWWGS